MTKPAVTLIATLVLGLSGIASSPAKAAGFGYYVASPTYGYQVVASNSYYPSQIYGGGFQKVYYPVTTTVNTWDSDHEWHDTSHFDYHPAELIQHGNHFHYQPAHYDYHQTGHWHHLHP
jgi:hypothetical protein